MPWVRAACCDAPAGSCGLGGCGACCGRWHPDLGHQRSRGASTKTGRLTGPSRRTARQCGLGLLAARPLARPLASLKALFRAGTFIFKKPEDVFQKNVPRFQGALRSLRAFRFGM